MEESFTLEDRLDLLQAEVERLTTEFDVYAGGGTSTLPVDRRIRAERLARTLYAEPGIGALEGFRYNCVVAKLNALVELWRLNAHEPPGLDPDPFPQHASGPRIHVDGQQGFTARTVRCSTSRSEPERMRELYGSFVLAKRSCGEPLGELPFSRFEQMIGGQLGQIRTKTRCKAVDFTIEIVGGSVKLKATAC